MWGSTKRTNSLREENVREFHKFHSWFPSGYYLELSEPNLRILKRPDDSMVAAFFPETANKAILQRTANEDYQKRSNDPTQPEPRARRGSQETVTEE